jgi:glycosyltransferase involved in cell wall biosynthesis
MTILTGDRRKRRVVLVMLEPPLPFGNAAGRWYYVLLRELAARGNNVTAFATCSNPDDVGRALELFPSPRYDLRCYPHPIRAGIGAKLETLRRPHSYMFSGDLRQALRAELERGFEILHLEQVWSGWLGLDHVDRAFLNVHYLWRIDQAQPSGTVRQEAHRRLSLVSEARLLRRFRYFGAASSHLEAGIRQVNEGATVARVRLGIDSSLYSYLSDRERTAEPIVSLIGSMNWGPSRSAAERLLKHLWPQIRAKVKSAKLQIVGWGARRALEAFIGMPGVDIVEDVDDARPYFAWSSVLLYAPVAGSGIKMKVLEALALGVPVVTTSEGVEGLDVKDGVEAFVSDNDAGLVQRTVELLGDREAQNRMRAAGRKLVETACSPAATVDAVERAYERMRP